MNRLAEWGSTGRRSTGWAPLFTPISPQPGTSTILSGAIYPAHVAVSCLCGNAAGPGAIREEIADAYAAPAAPCEIELERGCRGPRPALEQTRPRSRPAGRAASPARGADPGSCPVFERGTHP